MILKFILLSSSFLLVSVLAGEFADQLSECSSHEGFELGECVQEVIVSLKPRLRTGIEELGLPIMDPMTIPVISFTDRVPNIVEVTARFTNISVTGVADLDVQNVQVDTRNLNLETDLFIPTMNVTGNYNLLGIVLLLPISGRNTFWVRTENIDSRARFELDVVEDRFVVYSSDIDFNVHKIKLRLNNILGGEVTNRILNENSKLLLDALKPKVKEQLTNIVVTVLNDAFSTFSAKSVLQEHQARSVT